MAAMNPGPSFRHLLLLLQLAVLPGVAQGKQVVLGKAGGSVVLPCKHPQKNVQFDWKDTDKLLILGRRNFAMSSSTGASKLKDRVDSNKNEWDNGSYPLTIKNLQITDSGTYTCEVEKKKEEVELLVFRLNASPDTLSVGSIRLMHGQSLRLTLESIPDNKCEVKWVLPWSKKSTEGNEFSLPRLDLQHSGTWKGIVSRDSVTLEFSVKVFVLAFQQVSNTFYTKVGEPVDFSFPLTFEDENLKGELRWQEEGASSPYSWISFSLENKRVSTTAVRQDRKVQMKEALPLGFLLPQASPQNAGSGNLTLSLRQRQLRQEVALVVMRMNASQNELTCEVLGPSSARLTLSLSLENQTAKVSSTKKLLKVLGPEAGMWQCLLRDGGKVLLESKAEVLSSVLTWSWMTLLAIVVGIVAGFLICIGVCICCIKCWHRRRREAERMSQIKRLLSEKKTCQCPHRFQKTCNLI